MPNTNLTYLYVVADRSGSMEHLIDETVAGINKYLLDQKEAPGEALFSLGVFDDKFVTLHEAVPLAKLAPITAQQYWEGGGGGTALLDATGFAITRAKQHVDAMPEDLRPGKTLFVVITDGHENASREYTYARLKDLVDKARTQWQFDVTFLGANIDALGVAERMGVHKGHAINFNATKGGVLRAMASASVGTAAYRSSDASFESLSAQQFYGGAAHVDEFALVGAPAKPADDAALAALVEAAQDAAAKDAK